MNDLVISCPALAFGRQSCRTVQNIDGPGHKMSQLEFNNYIIHQIFSELDLQPRSRQDDESTDTGSESSGEKPY